MVSMRDSPVTILSGSLWDIMVGGSRFGNSAGSSELYLSTPNLRSQYQTLVAWSRNLTNLDQSTPPRPEHNTKLWIYSNVSISSDSTLRRVNPYLLCWWVEVPRSCVFSNTKLTCSAFSKVSMNLVQVWFMKSKFNRDNKNAPVTLPRPRQGISVEVVTPWVRALLLVQRIGLARVATATRNQISHSRSA